MSMVDVYVIRIKSIFSGGHCSSGNFFVYHYLLICKDVRREYLARQNIGEYMQSAVE